jgi:hypothetical protein
MAAQLHSGEEGTVAEAEMLAAEVQSARLAAGGFLRAVTCGPAMGARDYSRT